MPVWQWSKSCWKGRKGGGGCELGAEQQRERVRERRAPKASLFVGFSRRRGPRSSWWLWGRAAPFSLLTKAERGTGRQEGSNAILHGHIVCLTDGPALGRWGGVQNTTPWQSFNSSAGSAWSQTASQPDS